MIKQTKTDEVIQAAEARLAKLQTNLANKQARRDKEARGAVDRNGRTRPGMAERVAAKDVAIEATRGLIADAEAKLEAAKVDLPRRQQARKAAERADAEAQKLDAEAADLRARLERVESAAAEQRELAEQHRRQAARVQAEPVKEAASA